MLNNICNDIGEDQLLFGGHIREVRLEAIFSVTELTNTVVLFISVRLASIQSRTI